jgi:hypothetical protein
MIGLLAFRHLLVRRVRSFVLLAGFGLGVGVMIVLLSVGEAMLAQSRDVALVGGGEVTVLPQGIDLDALRTGGMAGMFFGIDRSRFVTRGLVGGPRQSDVVAALSPAIEDQLLYLCPSSEPCDPITVRAGGEIPSRAAAVGAGIDVVAGRWTDSPADVAWTAPTRDQLYDELDRFHLPPVRDSSWAEWHYFNVVTGPDEWWYVTLLIGGEVPDGRWGGGVLVTRHRPDGTVDRFTSGVPSERVAFDTAGADLTVGRSNVSQRDGIYHVRLEADTAGRTLRGEIVLRPLPNRWFPPLELSDENFVSGYVVPVLAGSATGRLCLDGACTSFEAAPGYHDHNWGVWRDVSWEWGAGRGAELSLLYGGVYGPAETAVTGASPFFLALVDSLGVRQVLRFRTVAYEGTRAATGAPGRPAPERFTLVASREADSVRLEVSVRDVQASAAGTADSLWFLQMRGGFSISGTLAGQAVSDTGSGFFETYVPRSGGKPRDGATY